MGLKLMINGNTVVRVTCWDRRTDVITAIVRDDTADDPSRTHQIKLAGVRSLVPVPDQPGLDLTAPGSPLYDVCDRIIYPDGTLIPSA